MHSAPASTMCSMVGSAPVFPARSSHFGPTGAPVSSTTPPTFQAPEHP